MRNEPKYEKVIRTFYYWLGRFKIKRDIPAVRDNRIHAKFCLDNWDNSRITLRYNSRILGHREQWEIISDILHEVGHVVHHLPYKTHEQRVKSEREAERFALKIMKREYPKEYRRLTRHLKKYNTLKKLKKRDPLYYEAWKTLPEYRGW